jgi:hypothetical protein
LGRCQAERTRGSAPRSGPSSQGRTGYLDTCLTQPKLTSPTDGIVGVEHTDNHAPDPPLENAFNAWDLWAVSGRARLQCREESRADEHLVRELPLQKSELGVLALPKFSCERPAQEDSVSTDKCTNLRDTRGGSLTDWRARSTARSISARSPRVSTFAVTS